MNMKLARRVLAVTMAASLLVVPFTVGATDTPSQSSTSETKQEATVAEVATVPTTSQVNDGGKVIKNEIPGAFLITANDPAFSGVAFTETGASVASKAGVSGKVFSHTYTLTRAKSGAAFASFDSAAASVGGKVVGGLNIDLGAISNGRFTSLPAGVKTTVSIKIKNAVPGATYYIARVTPGGATELIPITVDANGVASFEVVGGLAAYGLIQA